MARDARTLGALDAFGLAMGRTAAPYNQLGRSANFLAAMDASRCNLVLRLGAESCHRFFRSLPILAGAVDLSLHWRLSAHGFRHGYDDESVLHRSRIHAHRDCVGHQDLWAAEFP